MNVLKNEDDHNNKQILDYVNEKLHKLKSMEVNETQFTSNEYGNILLNSKFLLDVQEQLSYFSTQLNQIKQDYKSSLTKQRNN